MLRTLAISILIVALIAVLAVYAFLWAISWQAGLVITAVVAFCYGVSWATDYLTEDE